VKVTARRVLGWPARRVLDRRFANLVQWLDARLDGDRRAADEQLAAVVESFRLLNETLTSVEEYLPPLAAQARAASRGVVEEPVAFAALAGLVPPARILVAGARGSTAPLSLAALGHQVTVVDPEGYPLEHPGLVAVTSPPVHGEENGPGFDAAVVLSGGEADGGGGGEAPDLGRWVRPGGLLVVGARLPGPTPAVADGWQLLERVVAWRVAPAAWRAGSAESPQGDEGAAVTVLRRSQG
jgi:hypothetical protein